MICFHDFVQYLDRAGDIKKKLEDRSNGKQVILVPSINVWHASNIKDRIRRVVQSRGLRRMNRHISKLLQTTQTILELACDKSTLVLHMSRIFFFFAIRVIYLPVLAKNSGSSMRTISTSSRCSIPSGFSWIGLNLLDVPLTRPCNSSAERSQLWVKPYRSTTIECIPWLKYAGSWFPWW